MKLKAHSCKTASVNKFYSDVDTAISCILNPEFGFASSMIANPYRPVLLVHEL
jgi:hypothetical protein